MGPAHAHRPAAPTTVLAPARAAARSVSAGATRGTHREATTTEGLLRLAAHTGGPVQRWTETEPEDGGYDEVQTLLDGVEWDAMVDAFGRTRLADTLVAAVTTAFKGQGDAEMIAAFTKAAQEVVGGTKPFEAFEGAFLGYNADMSAALAETVRDAVQGAMAQAAAAKVAEEKAAEADALEEEQRNAEAAGQQKAALELQAIKDAEEQAKLDIQDVLKTFAADPILKNLKLKPEENRKLSLGPATSAQAKAAATLWKQTKARAQLTNFHTPGNQGDFVSKFRPPNIDVNLVLKCYVMGTKEIIVHISPDEALEKRMVAYHRNQISIDQKAEKQKILASASEGWKPK